MSESPFYPYPPRPGSHTESSSIEIASNKKVLDEKQRDNVSQFEHDLYNLQIDADQFPSANQYLAAEQVAGHPVDSLETVWRKKVNSSGMAIEYFLTPEGKHAWLTATGQELTGTTIEEISLAISSQDIRDLDSATLDKLEAESVEFVESSLTKQFIDNNFKGDTLASPSIISIYKNPEVLLEKAQGYRALKTLLIKAKADLYTGGADDNPETEAKLLIIDLYRKRINAFMASEYATAYKVLAQYTASEKASNVEVVTGLEATLPAFDRNAALDRIATFLQRIDRYQNGVSQDENGHYTWASPEAIALAEQAAMPHDTPVEADRGIYADIDPELLSSTKIDGETRGKMIENVLDIYGLLSAQKDWSSEREGPASDDKWQVIVNKKFKSLAVNDKQRVVKVPDVTNSLMATIPLDNHEVTHVLQHDNKRVIGQLSIMQSIGLDSASEQTESGGKWQEKVAKQALTGKTDQRIPGTGYFKALQVKARGGSYGEVVQAYYEDLQASTPGQSPDVAARQSVNRARRIFRGGGFEYAQNTELLTDTQPLSYLEQQLIYESLDDKQRRMLFIGGVTIRNLIRLSQVGLVDLNKVSIPEKMPWELMHDEAKRLVEQAADK